MCDFGLDFGNVIVLLSQGKCLRRRIWTDNMFVYKQITSVLKKEAIQDLQSMPDMAKKILKESDNNVISFHNQLNCVMPDGRITSWRPNGDDIFAQDWEEINNFQHSYCLLETNEGIFLQGNNWEQKICDSGEIDKNLVEIVKQLDVEFDKEIDVEIDLKQIYIFKESTKLLRELADLQNDAPLEKDRKKWEETMSKVYDFLKNWE